MLDLGCRAQEKRMGVHTKLVTPTFPFLLTLSLILMAEHKPSELIQLGRKLKWGDAWFRRYKPLCSLPLVSLL